MFSCCGGCNSGAIENLLFRLWCHCYVSKCLRSGRTPTGLQYRLRPLKENFWKTVQCIRKEYLNSPESSSPLSRSRQRIQCSQSRLLSHRTSQQICLCLRWRLRPMSSWHCLTYFFRTRLLSPLPELQMSKTTLLDTFSLWTTVEVVFQLVSNSPGVQFT